jgi:tripartite-type tricarboxylate transporter receptor subunit TctC
MRPFGRMLLLALLSVVTIASASAQTNFPVRPITLIVPLQAGTASDLVARILSEKVGAKLGQSIVVENAPGAGGATGSMRVARAAPDGYTIGALNNGVHTVLPHIVAKLPFEPFKDFEPITQLARFPSVLIVNKDLPVQTLKDFIALAKKDPGKLNYASVGPGSPQHLAMEQLKADAGIDMTHVPYRGGAQATQAIAAGEVNAFWIATSVALPFIEAGTVRVLAVGDKTRTKTLPNVPTVDEAAIPGYEYTASLALFAPAGTPKDVLDLLRREFTAALNDPDTVAKLQKAGLEGRSSTPEALQSWLKTEMARVRTLVERVGLQKN